MNEDEIHELCANGHVIGCHTATHHRMDNDDSDEILTEEIITSKAEIEKIIGQNVDIFCWVA